MSKYRYLLCKNYWKSRENFNKTFLGFRGFVFRYRGKYENGELAESFLQHILSQVRLP